MNARIVFGLLAALVIGAAKDGGGGGMTVDSEKKTISIAAKVAKRKLDHLSEVYPLEVVASHAHPEGQKAHETVVTFTVLPSEVHKALESFGLKPGKPAKGEGAAAEGPELRLFIELPGGKRIPIERTMIDRKTGKPLPTLKWHFTGSAMRQPDPDKPEKVYGADLTKTLISIFPVTDETVIQSSLTMAEEPLIKLETDKKLLPAEGVEVRLIIAA